MNSSIESKLFAAVEWIEGADENDSTSEDSSQEIDEFYIVSHYKPWIVEELIMQMNRINIDENEQQIERKIKDQNLDSKLIERTDVDFQLHSLVNEIQDMMETPYFVSLLMELTEHAFEEYTKQVKEAYVHEYADRGEIGLPIAITLLKRLWIDETHEAGFLKHIETREF